MSDLLTSPPSFWFVVIAKKILRVYIFMLNQRQLNRRIFHIPRTAYTPSRKFEGFKKHSEVGTVVTSLLVAGQKCIQRRACYSAISPNAAFFRRHLHACSGFRRFFLRAVAVCVVTNGSPSIVLDALRCPTVGSTPVLRTRTRTVCNTVMMMMTTKTMTMCG